VCGKSARTVRSGGGQKRAHGDDYSGTKPETAETDKSEPTGYRAGPRPYHRFVLRLAAILKIGEDSIMNVCEDPPCRPKRPGPSDSRLTTANQPG
jgi:hypothetical protein